MSKTPKADALRELGNLKRARLNAKPKLTPYAGKERGGRDDLIDHHASKKGKKS